MLFFLLGYFFNLFLRSGLCDLECPSVGTKNPGQMYRIYGLALGKTSWAGSSGSVSLEDHLWEGGLTLSNAKYIGRMMTYLISIFPSQNPCP